MPNAAKRSHSKKPAPKTTPDENKETSAVPVKAAAPTPAKVAQPKKPTKAAVEQSEIAKKVSETTRLSCEKLPYNFRTRSLARAIVDAVDEPDAKKAIRKTLKELRSFKDIKAAAVDIAGEDQFASLLADWFDAGEISK